MFELIRRWVQGVKKDNKFNYHKPYCKLRGHNFTVIKNNIGQKMWNCEIKYCPVCGERLKDGQ